jgi:hypothetical protein
MKIKLNEEKLQQIVAESVKKVLNEWSFRDMFGGKKKEEPAKPVKREVNPEEKRQEIHNYFKTRGLHYYKTLSPGEFSNDVEVMSSGDGVYYVTYQGNNFIANPINGKYDLFYQR